MLALGERNGVSLPYATVEEAQRAYRFADLQAFLDVYYEGVQVLRTEEDFHDLARAYMRRAHQDNVVHAEIFFDPQAHTARGIAFEDVLAGIQAGLDSATSELDMTAAIILCFLRDRSAEEAMAILERALPFGDAIVGVGLDSAEIGNPPSKFARVFDRARAEGFLTVAHAGEEGPPEYILEALDQLRARRIDHGVRCLEDPALVERLRRDQVPLTVCPLSNIRLGIFERIEEHNIGQLLDAGLCVTVNSDDPAYFGGYLNDNYLAIRDTPGIDPSRLIRLVRNSFSASFLDDAAKRQHVAEFDRLTARPA